MKFFVYTIRAGGTVDKYVAIGADGKRVKYAGKKALENQVFYLQLIYANHILCVVI